MNKEKSFAKELAELINRHSIDAKFETADDFWQPWRLMR